MAGSHTRATARATRTEEADETSPLTLVSSSASGLPERRRRRGPACGSGLAWRAAPRAMVLTTGGGAPGREPFSDGGPPCVGVRRR